MPGRGRGSGVRGPVPNQPVLSEKQRELLQSDKPPPQQPVEDQFEDPPTKDSVNEVELSESSSVISSQSPTQNGADDKTQGDRTQDDDKADDNNDSKTEPLTSNMTTPTNTTPTKTTPNDATPSKSPSKPLNVNAPVFVPISFEQPSVGGGPSLEFPAPFIPELTPEDILNGFPHKSSGDIPLLLTAATMLLEASHYPATFDTHLSILCHLLEKTTPTSDILDDLVEMLVFWVS